MGVLLFVLEAPTEIIIRSFFQVIQEFQNLKFLFSAELGLKAYSLSSKDRDFGDFHR